MIVSVAIVFLMSSLSEASSLYDIKFPNLKGEEIDFSAYKNKVLLIVNTASRCGFTPQLEGLQALYAKYQDRGFSVLGFPSNDFNQEDKEGKDIENFCRLNYGVKFPLFKKSHVKDEDKNPVYEYLLKQPNISGESVRWNFEKFLIDRKGNVIERYSTKTPPNSDGLIEDIEKALDVQ
jgi:glutathione peroxidase